MIRAGRCPSATALVITFSILCALAVLANLAFQTIQARAEIVGHNSRSATVLARVLAQQAGASLDSVELALQATERAILNLPAGADVRTRGVDQLFKDSLDKLPYIRALWVLDAHGNMIHDSAHLPGKFNLAERSYFQVHRQRAGLGLFVDRPIVSRIGVPFIALSWRISRADGSFGGVAVAALEPDYLRRYFDAIKPGGDGVIALLHDDGAVMLRVPAGPANGKAMPSPGMARQGGQVQGSYSAVSPIDGVARQYFFQRLDQRALMVVLGVGQAEMLAGWRRSALAYGAVSLAFLLMLFWLGRLALKELRIHQALNLALADSDAAMKAAQHLAQIGNWRVDFDTKFGKWSDEMYRILGLPPTAARFGTFLERIHADDRAALIGVARRRLAWSGELRTNPQHGPVSYLDLRASVLNGADGKPAALMGTLQDVTLQHRAQEKLRLSARVFEHTGDGIIVTDTDNLIVAVNSAFERITGYAEQDVLHKSPRMLHADLHGNAFFAALWKSVQTEGQWRGEVWGRRKNGDMFPEWLILSAITDQQGRIDGYVGVFTDLSEIRNVTAQLQFMHNHDPLTRLPNRSLLNDRLLQAIEAARPQQRHLGVLLLNVDRLKRVNEGIGHDAGDQLLRDLGARLLARVKPGDTLARLGSDEFVLLLTRPDDGDDINASAQQLLELVAQPFHVAGHELTVTASIGIALYPVDGLTPGELIKNADTALSHVKDAGRNSFRYFTAQMNIRAMHWMSLEHRLRGAMARNELLLYYQPQMALDGDRLSGVEALIRWHSAELGSVSPAEFIPLAEDTGLIIPIGEWVIRTACAQGKAWQDAGLAPVRIAVNVSAHQFTAVDVPALVRDALATSGLAPQYLAVELTESVLMKEADTAMRQIGELRAMGVTVALDDFGTGFSSLSYLSRFTLDKIKIDQSLVRNITLDHKNAAIAMATIGLAHGLGLTVVAEGVETREQLDFLRAQGCDEIQGYLFSKPVPAQQIALLLEAQCAKLA